MTNRHPKVIYTVRSELLSAEDARVRNGYVPWFLPIEAENAEMDEEPAAEVARLEVASIQGPLLAGCVRLG